MSTCMRLQRIFCGTHMRRFFATRRAAAPRAIAWIRTAAAASPPSWFPSASTSTAPPLLEEELTLEPRSTSPPPRRRPPCDLEVPRVSHDLARGRHQHPHKRTQVSELRCHVARSRGLVGAAR